MFNKLYPRNQIKHYLIIDVVSIIFLCYMVLSSDTAIGHMGNVLLLILFLASFYTCLWFRDWRLLVAMLLGYGTLTLFGIFIGESLLLFGFIFADLLGRARHKTHIGIGMFAIAIMFFLVIWLNKGSYFSLNHSILLPVMIVQILYPILIHIREKTKNLQGELDAANEQIEKYIQEEERHRIARDLHDTLGQTLTMIKLKSELTTRLIEKDPKLAKQELDDILATSRMALKQVRELVTDMKFVSLENEFTDASQLLETAGIKVIVEKKAKMPLLSSVEETMIALSVREAVTNIIRHSQAQQCNILIEKKKKFYQIVIKDDGIGLFNSTVGNGIQSIKERMKAIQGSANIDNITVGGTVVTLTLPINYKGKENHAS